MRAGTIYFNIKWIISRMPLSVIVLIIFLIFSGSVKVHAAEDDFFIVNGNLIKYQGSEKEVTIPDSVTGIGERAFLENEELTSVTIPGSVTKIGNMAFMSCKNLKDVTISNSVRTIGDLAFSDCEKLSKIQIPSSVTGLGHAVFRDSINLKEIKITSSIKNIGSAAFFNTPWLAEMKEKDPLIIINGILVDGTSCEGKIIIPNTVTSIGDSAFEAEGDGCKITEIILPASVKKIGDNAFSNCFNLKKINLPDTIEKIGDNAFFQCISLTGITLPKSLKSIGNGVFDSCFGLRNITIPNSVTSIGNNSFGNCRNLKSITIPKSVTKIGRFAFLDCSGLKEINIPGSVVSIEDDAFKNTGWLKAKQKASPYVILNKNLIDASKCKGKAIIPEGVEKINKSAFSGTKISSIVIPKSVKEIGEEAFSHCEELKTVKLPDSIKTIGDNAFAYCYKLNTITISKSVKQIGKGIFKEDKALSKIQVSAQNQNFASEGRMLFNKNKTVLISYSNAKGEIKLPEGIVEVADGAFDDTTDLKVTGIRFPGTLKKLGDYIFPVSYDSLEIWIPSSLVSFGVQNTALKSINVYKADGQVNFISEKGALYNKDKTILYYNPEKEDILVPDTVITIKSNAFPMVRKSITIPKSVINIGDTIIADHYYENLMENETPLYIYGFKDSTAELFSITRHYGGIRFQALD